MARGQKTFTTTNDNGDKGYVAQMATMVGRVQISTRV